MQSWIKSFDEAKRKELRKSLIVSQTPPKVEEKPKIPSVRLSTITQPIEKYFIHLP